jgi:nucleotide-binding universal stress UspA family protein
MKSIVLGYDETEPANRALERAAEIAKAFGSTLVVTSVVPTASDLADPAGSVDPTDSSTEHVKELAHARQYLEGHGVDAEYVRGVGDAAQVIVDLADERGADLIVVGTREHDAIQRLFRRSVSQAVSRHAQTNVLIVH